MERLVTKTTYTYWGNGNLRRVSVEESLVNILSEQERAELIARERARREYSGTDLYFVGGTSLVGAK